MPLQDGEKSAVKLSLPLEYQQDIYKELKEDDEVVVLAKGLGLLRIVANLLYSFRTAGQCLILIIGADDPERYWLSEELIELSAINRSPVITGLNAVTAESMTLQAREDLYKEGGVISVTSRILITDLLVKVVDPATITGIIVLHAERVRDTSTESFILRVFRQANKNGFIKAFSDDSVSLARQYSPLATAMRNLFVNKPSLWPRFQVTVKRAVEGKRKAEVIDFNVPMTEAMQDIQSAIFECMESSIKELKKSNSGLAMDDWTLDNAATKNFDWIFRKKLDENGHRTSPRTKQIANDLKTLQDTLRYLFIYDAVTFNRHLDAIRESSRPSPTSTRQSQSPWLFLDAANVLFSTAKQRVYRGSDQAPESGLQLVLEEQPKWESLSQILDEIDRDLFFNPAPLEEANAPTLIMCADIATTRQIREYLETKHISVADTAGTGQSAASHEASGAYMMREKLRNYIPSKKRFEAFSKVLREENEKALDDSKSSSARTLSYAGRPPPNKRRRIRGGGTANLSSRTLTTAIDLTVESPLQISALSTKVGTKPIEKTQPLNEDRFELCEMQDLVFIHIYNGDRDEQLLEELRPRYIIMYEPNLGFIRRVEVYRSSHRNCQVKIYFMYYGGSHEEKAHLTNIRSEKEAFEKLIRERAQMAMTLTADAPSTDDQEAFLRTVNTRIAGGGRLFATAQQPLVVVDVREMRSDLPGLLHGHNMRLIPCQLTVGDYILTPDLCVERKSMPDLISSFKTGRLFNQVTVMSKHYKDVVLLIEFDAKSSFTFDALVDYAHPNSAKPINKEQTDVPANLVRLTLAFPKLRIVWSSSPLETSNIFKKLKSQAPEPNPNTAVMMGLEAGQESTLGDVVWDQDPQDMLGCVSGITPENAYQVTSKSQNIVEVANWDRSEAAKALGKEKGEQLHRFFNRQLLDY
ncbi:MAG: hypothetical protein M1814_002294 [Vezdaea aestivalis]|nr:MAG: hypothetical protein M1814_002294 [Vezdaea aestivalis]